MTEFLKTGDKLVVISGLILVGWLYSHFWFSGGQSDFARISIDDQDQQLVSLGENKTIQIKGIKGISELQINDGRIRFTHSPCPNQICVHAGWLQHGGEFAACLPNHIAVEVVANNTLFDTINF